MSGQFQNLIEKSTPLIQIHHHSPPWSGICTPIKSGGVKLVLCAQTPLLVIYNRANVNNLIIIRKKQGRNKADDIFIPRFSYLARWCGFLG